MATPQLNWQDKENSPELEAFLMQFGNQYYLSAQEINELRDVINGLVAGNIKLIPHLLFNNNYKTIWNQGAGNISSNTSFGYETLGFNVLGNSNSGFGESALRFNKNSSANSAFGASALYWNKGSYNNGFGCYALGNNNIGNFNTAIGHSAGSENELGSNNIFIGYTANPDLVNQSNQIIIGSGASGAGSNSATLGNENIQTTVLRGKVKTDSSMQIGDDTSVANASKAGATRYRVSGNTSYCEMCMQTGASSYAWKIINQNNW
jgi:hypothetical protein